MEPVFLFNGLIVIANIEIKATLNTIKRTIEYWERRIKIIACYFRTNK